MSWGKVTIRRYLEGNGIDSCEPFSVPDYEGLPVRKCRYASADAGKDYFDPIQAQVLILNPSAKQLASWSIHACRVNGAEDPDMPECLKRISAAVIGSNSAQFTIAGSVVESICNSSETRGPCRGKSPTQQDIQNLAPRNTLFRDGVAIYIESISKWTVNSPISDETYGKLFDVTNSDSAITFWGGPSRVSSARREDWKAWRQHIQKPVHPDIADASAFDLNGRGWQIISREVHKSACRSDSNELFDALVYSRRWHKQH